MIDWGGGDRLPQAGRHLQLTLLLLGTILKLLGKIDEAKASYEKAVELEPTNDSGWLNHADLLRELKRPADAIDSYDKCIALGKDSTCLNRPLFRKIEPFLTFNWIFLSFFVASAVALIGKSICLNDTEKYTDSLETLEVFLLSSCGTISGTKSISFIPAGPL